VDSTKLVQQWIERCVINLALCPFASAPYRAGRVKIVVCPSSSERDYLTTIAQELTQLSKDKAEVETTLVVAENAVRGFLDFNEFLADVESLLEKMELDSIFQIASFHPQYRFAGVDADDVGNYTNRAPYPIVQWLRADTITKAVDATDTLAIPDANVKRLESMGAAECRRLFPWVSCVDERPD